MKAVILAGGLGTRLSEETGTRPKPMVEIGDKPIIWHIMKTYYHYGVRDFIICCGYKGHIIKKFFMEYFYNNSDLHIDGHTFTIESNDLEDWKITLADTGENAETGDRILAVKKYLADEIYTDKPFYLTYGDGVTDLDIGREYAFHSLRRQKVTMMTANLPPRFGIVETDFNNRVLSFSEKPEDKALINAGYFICDGSVFNDIAPGSFEKNTLPSLAERREVNTYTHTGFWKPMDTLKDKQELEEMWKKGEAPWKVW